MHVDQIFSKLCRVALTSQESPRKNIVVPFLHLVSNFFLDEQDQQTKGENETFKPRFNTNNQYARELGWLRTFLRRWNNKVHCEFTRERAFTFSLVDQSGKRRVQQPVTLGESFQDQIWSGVTNTTNTYTRSATLKFSKTRHKIEHVPAQT